MTWSNSMAGAAVVLSPPVKRRIGVGGFSIDDLGIVENAQAIADILRLGLALKAFPENDLDAFLRLAHGSSTQAVAAEHLCGKSLTRLSSIVNEKVIATLDGVPGVDHERFTEYQKWATSNLWEYPVGYLDVGRGASFCLAEEAGLSVFECDLWRVKGDIGDALFALTELLTADALKMKTNEAFNNSLMMGLDASSLLSQPGFDTIRGSDARTVLEWTKQHAKDFYEELGYWDGDEEAMQQVALEARDLAIWLGDEQRRIENVLGNTRQNYKDGFAKQVELVRVAALKCEPGTLQSFVLAACACLAGASTLQLLDRLNLDQRFEYLPGHYSLLDTGLEIEGKDERYNYINETAMNEEDIAMIPLSGNANDIVAFLTRISVAERLLMALSVLAEIHA